MAGFGKYKVTGGKSMYARGKGFLKVRKGKAGAALAAAAGGGMLARMAYKRRMAKKRRMAATMS